MGAPVETFVAEVINLREGGLGLAAEKDVISLVFERKLQFQIQVIKGDLDLSFLVGEKTEVRWFVDSTQNSFPGFGCRSLSISDSARRQLQKAVFEAMKDHRKSFDD